MTFCGICDGPLFEGKPVAVIGGGNAGFEEALEMERFATEIFHITDNIVADPVLVDRVEEATKIRSKKGYSVVRFEGEEELDGIVILGNKNNAEERLSVKGAFVKIGMRPNSDFVAGLLRTNERGEIVVSSTGETSMDGIFAAGDVTSGSDSQVVISAGQGAQAALAAARYIVSQR